MDPWLCQRIGDLFGGGELGGSMIMVKWIERLGEKGRGERKLGTKESDPGPERVWHRV